MADAHASSSGDRRELLERSLVTIRDLRARLTTLEHARAEPIAIVGLACRFPGGASTPDNFWELLRSGRQAIGPVPEGRWPEAEAAERAEWSGGFLSEDVAAFDARFFGISPREAEEMDPQHRLLLETSWEAIERAGLDAAALRGARAGVFVGISGSEYGMLPRAAGSFGPYTATGLTANLASGRLAYFLGWHGPAVSVDTACSSSLVAVHLACRALQAGDCELALAAGVNLMLSPQPFRALRSLGALAADGRCKTFAAAADGYGRGEGGGVVVLKRLSRALADGDVVMAVIRGSAANQDGASSGLTVPNGLAQQALQRQALAGAGVAAAEIDYAELHGTGTPLGDPIEVQALAEVHRGRGARPLRIGAVKSAIGHLEAAAGIAGLIKVVLALRHGEIPPQPLTGAINPRLKLEAIPAVLPAEAAAWETAAGRRRIATVSAFGFSGTNAHVVVEEPPAGARAPCEPATRFERRRYWLPVATVGARGSAPAEFGPRRIAAAMREEIWEFTLSWANLADLGDNQGVLHVGHYQALVAATLPPGAAEVGCNFENVEFLFLLRVAEEQAVSVQVLLEPVETGAWRFRVCSRPKDAGAWVTHAQGRVRVGGSAAAQDAVPAAAGARMSGDAFYARMAEQGFRLGPGVRLLREVESGDGWARGTIAAGASAAWTRLAVAPAVFDVCGQLLLAAAAAQVPARTTFMVKRWERIAVAASAAVAAGGEIACRLRVRAAERGASVLVADYRLETAVGETIAEAAGVEFQLLAEDRLRELQRAVESAAAPAARMAAANAADLRAVLLRAVGAALRVPVSELDAGEPLRRLGLDSITGLEVRARVERETGVALAPEWFIVGPSIDELVGQAAGGVPSAGATAVAGNPWIVREARRPAARVRLFCVPSGALGASQYAGWQPRLPEEIEVCAVQLPGREERLAEPPFEDLEALLDALEAALQPELDRPYAIYGHSMGALIAFRLVRRLWQRAAIKPVHFFPGAYTAPVLPNPVVAKYRRRFQAAGLPGIPGPRDVAGHAVASRFVREGLAATTALNTDELAGALLPTMLADMQLVERYAHDPAEPPLPVPITAFHGAGDADVTPAEMERWRELTSGAFACHVLPGDHFFMHRDQSRDALVAAIAAVLASVTAIPSDSRRSGASLSTS